jgi:ketosteroid isomerase-like protein
MRGTTLDLAQEAIEALSRQDLRRLLALTTPDVEWYSFFAALTEEGVYRGPVGTERYIQDLNDAFEVVRADIDDGVAVGDVALLVGRIHYRGKGSGVETESAVGWTLKFRDGKLARFRAFRDPEQAFEALGER